MNPEFWAILGVGVAGLALGWHVYARIDTRFDAVDRRLNDLDRPLARIEGWIAGRFGEETVPST